MGWLRATSTPSREYEVQPKCTRSSFWGTKMHHLTLTSTILHLLPQHKHFIAKRTSKVLIDFLEFLNQHPHMSTYAHILINYKLSNSFWLLLNGRIKVLKKYVTPYDDLEQALRMAAKYLDKHRHDDTQRVISALVGMLEPQATRQKTNIILWLLHGVLAQQACLDQWGIAAIPKWRLKFGVKAHTEKHHPCESFDFKHSADKNHSDIWKQEDAGTGNN